MKACGRAAEAGDETLKKELGARLEELQAQYDVTWDYCRGRMTELEARYGIDSAFALAKAEEIWSGVRRLLYGGEELRLREKGDLPFIRAKIAEGGITVSLGDNGRLQFGLGGLTLTYMDKPDDKFIGDGLAIVLAYLGDPGAMDRQAAEGFLEGRHPHRHFPPSWCGIGVHHNQGEAQSLCPSCTGGQAQGEVAQGP